MKYEDLKAALLNLEDREQRRLILELLPEIWPKLAADNACVAVLRKLLDEESVRIFQEEHLDHI